MDKDKTVFFIFPKDIASVQGSTEAYYIGKHFSEKFDTHLFSVSDGEFFGARVHSIIGTGFLSLVLLNSLFLPYFLYLGIRHRPTVVYFYRNVILPPLLLKYTVGSTIVCDLQCDPYEQPKEFFEMEGGSVLQRMFIELSLISHRFVMQRSDIIVTLSEPLKAQLADRYRIDLTDILVVPLGVDTEKFRPVSKEGDRTRLIYLGSIGPRRNVGAIANALTGLSEAEQRRVSFEIFGEGDDSYIDQLRTQLSKTECVFIYHGYIPHEKIPEEVGACDIAVSPLPQHDAYEVSSPAKIFEYLALGLPVIATAIKPHETWLTHERDALFVEPENANALRDAIRRLLSNEQLITELSEGAREDAMQHSWGTRFEEIISAIDGVQTSNKTEGNESSPHRDVKRT